MARDRVVERRAEMRSLSIVASETRVRLGNVGGRTLRRRPPILLWHDQHLERGLRVPAAQYGHLKDLGLATGGCELQIALGTVDLPDQVRPARNAAAIVDRYRCPALEQSADQHLFIRGHGLDLPR